MTGSVSTCLLGLIVMASFAECHETGVYGLAKHAVQVYIPHGVYVTYGSVRFGGFAYAASVCDSGGVGIRTIDERVNRDASKRSPLKAAARCTDRHRRGH